MNLPKKTPVYFISGLGIDERALCRIVLPEEFEIRHVRWIEPEKKEPFRDYCKRLSAQIDFSAPVILAGMSFGGMTSCELSKIIPVKKIILLSSISNRNELPKRYRFLAFFNLQNLIPPSWVTHANFILYWLFGLKKADEKNLLKDIMDDISENFLVWAANTILKWDNTEEPPNVVRIHGTRDRVLSFIEEEVEYPVKDSGHFMVYTHSAEVNAALNEILKSL